MIAVAAIATGAWTVARLGKAAPAVARAGLYFDTVRRGAMLRTVGGPGRLVPKRIRWVTALHAGRVEAIHVEPGSPVHEKTVILELSNSDVELAALQADMALKEAEADLTSLRAQLESAELAQQAVIEAARAQLRDAKQTEIDDANLFHEKIIAKIIYERSKNRRADLAARLAIEQKRLTHHGRSKVAQLAAQSSRLRQLRSIQAFRRKQLTMLHVRAGAEGVCQELPLELGQWVTPGALLAKVVDPTELKAELRIAELQAKEIHVGQKTIVDTRNGKVPARVARIDPAVSAGTVTVDVVFERGLPKGSRPDQSIEGTIELENLRDVVFVRRPVFGDVNETVGIFKLDKDDHYAERVPVRFGKTSVTNIQILEGLTPGDRVILSDMSRWTDYSRVRLN